jgi:hypothetical protein
VADQAHDLTPVYFQVELFYSKRPIIDLRDTRKLDYWLYHWRHTTDKLI